MKKVIFKGASTAIVTPFKDDKIDYKAYEALLEFQIKNSIDGIVVCGTTGEASTLTDEEHKDIISFTVEKVNGRVPVIAGTGSNDTSYALQLSKFAAREGADALLLITPYYNKATQKGLIKSFQVIADATDKPCIIYNVPSRTGLNVLPETCYELSKHENIVAVKEASSNIVQIAAIASMCGDSLAIYSGNDDQIVPLLSLGALGVISVLSNILPKETHDICDLYFKGDHKKSLELQLKYLDLINAIFCEVNPIPVKTAMAILGMCSEEMRLPLCEMEEKNRQKLIRAMEIMK